MIELLVPKYSSLKIFRITETTTDKDVLSFFLVYKRKPKKIKKLNTEIVIWFTDSYRVSLKQGSILYFDGSRFNYVLAEDAPVFEEFFFKASDIISNDVYKQENNKYYCKNCGISFKEKFDECPNCGITIDDFHNNIKKSIKLNKVKEAACSPFEQYRCPNCNYISLKPFSICPNCNSTEQNSTVEFTDVTTKLKKESNMCKENTKNVEEVEEKEEETKVTAVYGDCVSVPNTEVQENNG